MASTGQLPRRPYQRSISPTRWWLDDPHFGKRYYREYVAREATCIAIAIYVVLFVIGLWCLAAGEGAYTAYMGAMQSPLGVILQLILLAGTVYHAYTWFQLAPQGMKPFRVKGEKVPPEKIVQAHFGAWAVVSIVILLIVWIL
jgi:fumarate reductase subunit C